MTSAPVIISREDARAAGLKRYYTGEPCRRGHVGERYVQGHCVKCSKKYRGDWNNTNREKLNKQARDRYNANPEKARKLANTWNRFNRERVNKRSRDWNRANKEETNKRVREEYKANPEKRRKRARDYRKANREKTRKSARDWSARDRKKDPERIRKYSREQYLTKQGRLRAFWGMIKKRMGLKRGARQKLLHYTAEEFQAHLVNTLPGEMTYKEAREAKYQHDHIVPISYISRNFPFDIACKMVVDLDNLRFIPATENMQKHAKMGEPYQLAVLDILKKRYL